jgi:hypothetical protein
MTRRPRSGPDRSGGVGTVDPNLAIDTTVAQSHRLLVEARRRTGTVVVRRLNVRSNQVWSATASAHMVDSTEPAVGPWACQGLSLVCR